MKRIALSLCVASAVSTALLTIGSCGGGSSTSQAVDPQALPPDPADNGKLTLAGIDSDQNGVRDDTQRTLSVLEYTPEQYDAAVQLAKGIQAAIEFDGTDANLPAVGTAMARAVDCASHLFGASVMDEILTMELIALNTEARSAAYERFNSMTVGQQFGDMASKEVACD